MTVPSPHRSSRWIRDLAMFVLGVIGFLHEAFMTHGERPTLLLACLALMGLPIFLRQDEDKDRK